jgi:hypothetical protein
MDKTKNTPWSIPTPLCANTLNQTPITEEQLDWVEKLDANFLVIGSTRSGKTRLPVEFIARSIEQGGRKNDQA